MCYVCLSFLPFNIVFCISCLLSVFTVSTCTPYEDREVSCVHVLTLRYAIVNKGSKVNGTRYKRAG